jgi:16S rRNA (uracil1498-N3)-methyltransferase
MHRFFIPPSETQTRPLMLSGPEAHHALHVVRVRRGQTVQVLDGAGNQFECEVLSADRYTVTLDIRNAKFFPPSSYEFTLIQAVTKGKTMDRIVQKATELGATRIVPVLAERSVAHLDQDDAREKAGKWQATAVEAIKQCGRAWAPRIEIPLSIPAYLEKRESFDLAFLASLEADRRHPRECFLQDSSEHRGQPAKLAAWVGPEGDFTREETERIRRSGAQPVSLGPAILRSETAALYLAAIVSYEMQARNLSSPGSP